MPYQVYTDIQHGLLVSQMMDSGPQIKDDTSSPSTHLDLH